MIILTEEDVVPARNQVWHELDHQVCYKVENQVSEQVWYQVREQVSEQVWGQVRDQIYANFN
jgi:hypothetical protein